MSRIPVQVREATVADAAVLLELWSEFSRPSPAERIPGDAAKAEAVTALARVAADPDQRLVVGLLDDRVVGAAHLVRAYVSPIHGEMAVHITHLHVSEKSRRHGVGRALIDAAVTWAEEKDTGHILAAASAQSRDANRFMARHGLAQMAVVRRGAVPVLRSKLPVDPPAGAMVTSRNHRSVGQVLAQRRSLRRAQSRSS